MSHTRRDISLLVTRLILGGIFIAEGWMKIGNMPGTVAFFDSLGIPSFLAYVVAYLELIGGAMVVLGLWTCLVAMILSVIMVGAIWFTRANGLMGIAFPLATLGALVALVGVCGGKYAIKCFCDSGCCDSSAGTCPISKEESAK